MTLGKKNNKTKQQKETKNQTKQNPNHKNLSKLILHISLFKYVMLQWYVKPYYSVYLIWLNHTWYVSYWPWIMMSQLSELDQLVHTLLVT